MVDPSEPTTSSLSEENWPTNIKTAWDRICVLHSAKSRNTIERDLIYRCGLYGLTAAGLLGYIRSIPEAQERLRNYTIGKRFLSKFDLARARLDFYVIFGLRRGIALSVRMALPPFLIFLAISHLTVARDKFAAWYLPVTTIPIYSLWSYPYGRTARVQGTIFGITTGLLMATSISLSALSLGKNSDELYRQLKSEYESKLLELDQPLKKPHPMSTLFGRVLGNENENYDDSEEDDW